MNPEAKELWDKSIDAMASADVQVRAGDINQAIAWTSVAEIYLAQAEFAAKYPEIIGVIDPVIAAVQQQARQPVPQGPVGGPKLWGTPQ